MKIILYTTHCPRCTMLMKKLNEKGIEYEEETDIDKMLNLGMIDVPVLEVDGQRFDYRDAIKWVSEQ